MTSRFTSATGGEYETHEILSFTLTTTDACVSINPPAPVVPAVPEASTLWLLGSGAAGLAGYIGVQWRARRKSRR